MREEPYALHGEPAQAHALLAWIALQIVVLSIGAMRVPLSARAGREPQDLAFPEMIVVQLAISTMLLPILDSQGIATAVALIALPFLQLAAFLTSTAPGPQLAVSLAMLLWIAGLRAWAAAIRSTRNRLVAVAILNCIVIGGPVLTYLVRDFSDTPASASWKWPELCNPLGSLLSQAAEVNFTAISMFAPAALLFSGAIMWATRKHKFFRDSLST
jgi:hypothetical protein